MPTSRKTRHWSDQLTAVEFMYAELALDICGRYFG